MRGLNRQLPRRPCLWLRGQFQVAERLLELRIDGESLPEHRDGLVQFPLFVEFEPAIVQRRRPPCARGFRLPPGGDLQVERRES